MSLTATKIKRLFKRKLATVVLVTASVAAFATYIDEGGKKSKTTTPERLSAKTFSLKAPYQYGNKNTFNLNNKPSRYIMLNTVVTYQKGNATYILPLKKKVILDKIKFNPAPSKF
jgi:flagellar basal body-associated protein FliL